MWARRRGGNELRAAVPLAIKATLAQLPPNHNDRVWAELSPADVRFLTDERDKG